MDGPPGQQPSAPGRVIGPDLRWHAGDPDTVAGADTVTDGVTCANPVADGGTDGYACTHTIADCVSGTDAITDRGTDGHSHTDGLA